MEHPKDIGDRSQLAVMAVLRDLGYGMYLPYGENTRSDLVLEREGCISRVQCKTGRLRAGAVIFNVCSFYGHHRVPKPSRPYHGEIDYFAVYCPDNGVVYLVPIEDLPTTRLGTLRVDPPKNNQFERVRFAARYEVGRVAIEGLRGSAGA